MLKNFSVNCYGGKIDIKGATYGATRGTEQQKYDYGYCRPANIVADVKKR